MLKFLIGALLERQARETGRIYANLGVQPFSRLNPGNVVDKAIKDGYNDRMSEQRVNPR